MADTPEHASDYLRPLLSFAAAHVPVKKHKETPLYILCTAGMRLLPERWDAGSEKLREMASTWVGRLILPRVSSVVSWSEDGVWVHHRVDRWHWKTLCSKTEQILPLHLVISQPVVFTIGGWREREGEKINVWLPFTCPELGIWPATQACAQTGNWISDPLQAGNQFTEPQQPGL